MNSGQTIPQATYRLQFHRGFTLRHALELIPYFSALGISHVYASPLLKARTGSTHGYDVCDPSLINPEIGSEADLEALVLRLREHAMGLVLDIVPNHVAAVAENPWWWDVLQHGRSSRFAECFDINWDSAAPTLQGKVFLPVLGDDCERVLERGELQVVAQGPCLMICYFDQRFPITPSSLQLAEEGREAALIALNRDCAALARLLEQQHYFLANWREGDARVNYRRFFTITHLAGVRVEQPEVFNLTHSHLLGWYQRGMLDGLRVDHPDGLRDPLEYLSRLRQAAPGAWIVVEKILEPGEDLPPDWPVDGTTGYDFLTRVNGLFVDPANEQRLTEFYAAFTGESTDFAAMVRAKKRWILRHQLVSEVNRLVDLLCRIAAGRAHDLRVEPDEHRETLIELIACFPVYRTYAQAERGHVSASDTIWNSQAQSRATELLPMVSAPVLAFLIDLLQLRLTGALENEFVMRFQQLTGPTMAKGVEDTSFYCFNRFIGLNEVGGDPAQFGLSVAAYHSACGRSQKEWPNTQLATSTHDTKRSEDVRARLALLSEIPQEWEDSVSRWSAMNGKHHSGNGLDRNLEYLFYQTLIGAWPLTPDRAIAYLIKAAREAKQHTQWTDSNAPYEAAVANFVSSVLADSEFVADAARFVDRIQGAGHVNALAQTLLKLTAPGVPDIYQGTELWDWSLVDPDNRRPVDFSLRGRALAEQQQRRESVGLLQQARELLRDTSDGSVKLFVIQQALLARQRLPHPFREGRYVPVSVTGSQSEHVCASSRDFDPYAIITVVPRLIMGLMRGRGSPPVGEDVWTDTQLILPSAYSLRQFRNVFTGEIHRPIREGADAVLPLAEVLGRFPVGLLESVPAGPSSSRMAPQAP